MRYYLDLGIRILLCFVPVSVFFVLMLPLTVKGTALFLLGYDPIVMSDSIFIRGHIFEFVEACIATASYYLLWVLTLLTKDLSVLTRVKMIVTGFALFLAMNIIRIVILIIVALNNQAVFDWVHLIFWKFISGVYVAGVWFFLVYIFKVKSIPLYDELKFLWKKSFLAKK